MKKMWTLKNAAVAVLGALFLGGICKLGIFFSVMLGISLFLLVPGIMSGIAKRERIVGTFFRGLYLFRADGGSVSKKPKDLPVSFRNRNAFPGWKNERSVTEGSEGV